MKNMIIRNVPQSLHTRLKMAAAQNGVTMNALIIEAIRQILEHTALSKARGEI